MHSINRTFATGEAARRYYAAKEFAISGVPNVFSPLTPILDNKFLDYYFNICYHFSNEPLKQSLKEICEVSNCDEARRLSTTPTITCR